ncbi:MAG: peptidoglycan D,D-transpeptidase FtsI family protein [Acidimicrobiales bacterium]
MDRRIKVLGAVLLVCFGVLFLQLNNLQVLQAGKLAHAPGNPRTFLARVSQPRGDIQTADGVVVARSVPSHDSLAYLRQYPQGPLYAGVTGYDSVVYGTAGAEQTYDKYLVAHSAAVRSLSDLLTNRTTTDTVTLSISSTLQQLARQSLGNRPGAVVALDPSTGAILAMYSSPTFDPNLLTSHNTTSERQAWRRYIADPSQPLVPRAYRQRYPPGSTFKIVVSAAVYDHDPKLATKSYPVVSSIPLPQTTKRFHNYAYESCGGMLPELFKVSCDTGYAEVALDLGGTSLSQEARAFGFDHAPPIDLPDPAVSSFPPGSSFAHDLPGLAYSAIGQQDVAASALEMAMVGGAIADGGRMMTPHVMSQVRDSQGNVVVTYQPKLWRQATSDATAAQVTKLMELVTTQGGTAPNVAIPGVKVAAKTGTAQLGTGKHENDDWLVAFAPAKAPHLAVAVVVDNQPGTTVGATTAGPIARAMLAAGLKLGTK